MQLWTAVAIGAGTLLVTAGLITGGWFAWSAYTRKALLGLVVRAEAVEAAAQALHETVSALAVAEDAVMQEFAVDPDSTDRRALHEIAARARILSEELDTMPLPRRLIPAAEALADAAYVVASEASRVDDAHRAEDALEELSATDLVSVRSRTAYARGVLAMTCDACGLDETAVYGGGLYL